MQGCAGDEGGNKHHRSEARGFRSKMSHVQIGLEALVDELRSKPTAPVVMETQQVESAGFGGLLDVLTGGTATHTPIPSRAPSRAAEQHTHTCRKDKETDKAASTGGKDKDPERCLRIGA